MDKYKLKLIFQSGLLWVALLTFVQFFIDMAYLRDFSYSAYFSDTVFWLKTAILFAISPMIGWAYLRYRERKIARENRQEEWADWR